MRIESVTAEVGDSETGLALFAGEKRIVAVVPPFPLDADGGITEGVDLGPIAEVLNRDLLIAIVFLRLGRYAVGVVANDRLAASKTDSRYVKRRHRAGGSSQRRFERSRERLVRELFDKTCRVFRDVVSPYADRIDYVRWRLRHSGGGYQWTARARRPWNALPSISGKVAWTYLAARNAYSASSGLPHMMISFSGVSPVLRKPWSASGGTSTVSPAWTEKS